jgi:oligoribonuclease NrnB/cAMP/cGMP phosphodiesterase (DHH superfamily)
MKKGICIYHGGCPDGFASAWLWWQVFRDDFEYYPGVYNQPPPDVSGRKVVLVDFSYKRPIMEQIIKDAESVEIIDHHQSAEEDLKDLVGAKTLIFDKSHSACILTKKYLNKNHQSTNFPTTAGQLLEYIEDRDLWTLKLPSNGEFYAALRSYPQEFELWNSFNVACLIKEGISIRRYHLEIKKEMMKNVITRTIGGHAVPCVNAPWLFASEIAGDLAEGQPFAACYWDTPNGTTYSLRSKENGLDVAKIAEQYQGGGHKHASGFTDKTGLIR